MYIGTRDSVESIAMNYYVDDHELMDCSSSSDFCKQFNLLCIHDHYACAPSYIET